MSYLDEFQKKIDRDDFQGYLVIWEEYCAADEVDGRELESVLNRVRGSRFAGRFGPLAQTALPLWERVEDEEQAYRIFKLIVDLETQNPHELAALAYAILERRYGNESYFNEKIRLVGLRNREFFQGSVRNFELLRHLNKGRFVFHTGGWGTGEIVELSLVREELVIEFERVSGRKSMSFENAFSTLIPLSDDHFLSRRFGDPDQLEEEARKDPVGVVQLLLKDLGPKSAAEIKEELCDLVIPAKDWTKWWQSARTRIKKDTRIETPSAVRFPFRLREEEVSHVDRLKEALKEETTPERTILLVYNFIRDFPEVQKSTDGREFIQERLGQLLRRDGVPLAIRIQANALLEEIFGGEVGSSLAESLKGVRDLPSVIESIEIAAFKKRALVAIRQTRSDWIPLFLDFFFSVKQSALRDYLLKELGQGSAKQELSLRIEQLLHQPAEQPNLFIWYFQKVMDKDEDALYVDKSGQCQFFEGFLMLLHQLENQPAHREHVKKMYSILTSGRFALVREILKGSPIEFAKEFLLLVSKLQTLNSHDVKIMHALAEVAHPTLAQGKRESGDEESVIWTTEAGYQRLRDRMNHIGTTEMVDNAREIEVARAHGDLRENAEYKAALERRARLQSELRTLSDQLSAARILTENDVSNDVVGVGAIVELLKGDGERLSYTILGPWDADPDQHILSFQSRLAKAMSGLKEKDEFSYQGESYTIDRISTVFQKGAIR